MAHVPFTKAATFRTGILKALLLEINHLAVIYTSLPLVCNSRETSASQTNFLHSAKSQTKPHSWHSTTLRMAGFPPHISKKRANLFNLPFKGLPMSQDRRLEVMTKRGNFWTSLVSLGFLRTDVDVCEPAAEIFSREIPALLVTHCMRSQENEPGQHFTTAFGGGC